MLVGLQRPVRLKWLSWTSKFAVVRYPASRSSVQAWPPIGPNCNPEIVVVVPAEPGHQRTGDPFQDGLAFSCIPSALPIHPPGPSGLVEDADHQLSEPAPFMIKAGAQRIAAELGLMLVAPDTSPRDV